MPTRAEASASGGPSEVEMTGSLNKNCDPELAFVWSEEEVLLDIQYKLVKGDKFKPVKTLRSFSGLQDDKAEMRKVFRDDFSITDRVDLSALVSAWEVASVQIGKENEAKAMAKVTNMARPLTDAEQTCD